MIKTENISFNPFPLDTQYSLDVFKNPQPKKTNNLNGDIVSLRYFDDELISQISKFQSEKNLSYQLNPDQFLRDIEDFKKVKISSDEDEEDELNSLGEKVTTIQPMRRFSEDFLEKLYNQGTVSNPSNKNLSFKKSSHSLETNNPYVYSFTKLHPFSFFYGNKSFVFEKDKIHLQYPEPLLITSEDWSKKPDLSKDGILHEFKITDKHGILLIEPKTCAKFKGLVSNMVKQIIMAAFGHKISLPVRLFEPKCLLHRLAEYLSFSNKFLVKASDPNTSPLERMKLTIAMGLAGLYIPTQQLKPFNPLIGETFQGEFEGGGMIYVEQVSHRPLVSRFILKHPKYQIIGFYEFIVRPEGLGYAICIHQKGPITITFPNINSKIIWNLPIIRIAGAQSEKERACTWIGTMNFVDSINGYRGIVKFVENKKRVHEVRGVIYPQKFPSNYKFDYSIETENGKKFKLNQTKNLKVLARVSGSWLDKVLINDRVYWDIDKDEPDWLRPVKNCIPSDGRFREDLIWLYRSFYCAKNEEERVKYETISQDWKVLMEKFQRIEREMRIKVIKGNKKK